MMIDTHRMIDRELCGNPLSVGGGASRVALQTTQRMAADASGLVHGGFIFGLADYAAMLAVNHPNVVLGAAEVKFLQPVRVPGTVVAEARVAEGGDGKKKQVTVTATLDGTVVFEGRFTCFVLARHVLQPPTADTGR